LFAEIPKLQSNPPLDPTVNSSLTIYGVDLFEILGFIISRLAKTRFFPFGLSSAETPSDSHVFFLPMDGPDKFWDFAYRDFHVPVQL
jgi:hypothetical protein